MAPTERSACTVISVETPFFSHFFTASVNAFATKSRCASLNFTSRLFDRTTLTLISAVRGSGGCQQLDNLIDGFVGAVVGGFELAVWAMFCVGLVVEVTVGEWSAQTFVEE